MIVELEPHGDSGTADTRDEFGRAPVRCSRLHGCGLEVREVRGGLMVFELSG
jgi:hypothetical protein